MLPGGLASAAQISRARHRDRLQRRDFIVYPLAEMETPSSWCSCISITRTWRRSSSATSKYPVSLFDLFITTDSAAKAGIITRHFTGWTEGQVEVRVTPNRGRDIAPKLLGFRAYLRPLSVRPASSFDRSPTTPARLPTGAACCSKPCSVRRIFVRSVFDVFTRRSDIGIIAPQHFEAVRHWINWGGNFKAAEALAQRMGEHSLSMDKPADFPSVMFWARSAALRPLLH